MREKTLHTENAGPALKGQRGRAAVVKYAAAGLIIMIAAILPSPPLSAGISGAYYLYNLSDFSGTVPYNWAGLTVDEARNEIYVIYKNDIEIYNDKGMKIYSFGDDENIRGVIYDVAVDRDGTIFLLLLEGDDYSLLRCNYRGEPVSEIKLTNIPPGYMNFSPDRVIYLSGNLYLADLIRSKKVIITDSNGVFKDGYDINSLFGLDDLEGRPGHEKEIAGFSVDEEGHMLFTVPTIFRAFRLSPDRKVQSFGEPGNIPGKFSVVAGIASDAAGNYYIADTLKSVIMIFDSKFKFIMEFGYRGDRPGNLIAPRNMVVSNGNVYVSQSRKRGVSVFKIQQN